MRYIQFLCFYDEVSQSELTNKCLLIIACYRRTVSVKPPIASSTHSRGCQLLAVKNLATLPVMMFIPNFKST